VLVARFVRMSSMSCSAVGPPMTWTPAAFVTVVVVVVIVVVGLGLEGLEEAAVEEAGRPLTGGREEGRDGGEGVKCYFPPISRYFRVGVTSR
jgi:hypothetical protein